MSFACEFKESAMKGNVVDLAVGVVIGGAFGKIVSSLVENVIMPVVGVLTGGVNFSTQSVAIGMSPKGEAVLLKYGAFIQSVVDVRAATSDCLNPAGRIAAAEHRRAFGPRESLLGRT